ncbi:hypothetical protein HOU02_gp078 [Caulobacter phage CcrBL9]|uniref:Uncharacterized protein n=1 Tax=Caulobacter phage CcrBL9 TaxID=2283270 RepID=A0A385EE26_9CAUD|nr:hypothetical protein HOU02_gp078 [Caulobacter phage CcrBL9]AXQ69102.1 hypothetical protein CcrBL9_gp078c [Caulobacter phage CcrBL9]
MSHDPIHVIATLYHPDDLRFTTDNEPAPFAIVEIGMFSQVVAMGFKPEDYIRLTLRPGDNLLSTPIVGEYRGTIASVDKAIARHTDEAGTPFVSEVHLSVDLFDGPDFKKVSHDDQG